MMHKPTSMSFSYLLAFAAFSFITFHAKPALSLTKDQLAKCVKAEAKTLRSKSILNMNEIETKVLNDSSSLRAFIEDSAEVKTRDANPIARTMLKEATSCEDLAAKWYEKPEAPRSTADQIVEIFAERGATIRAEDVEPKILKPALTKFNDKVGKDFSLQKHPGLATLAAIYLTPEGAIVLPTSPKIPEREKKVGQQLLKAQSADEAEQVIVIDTRNSLADQLESKLKLALKSL